MDGALHSMFMQILCKIVYLEILKSVCILNGILRFWDFQMIVLGTRRAKEATPRILELHGVPSAMSEGLNNGRL
jgi:hypothetical protein